MCSPTSLLASVISNALCGSTPHLWRALMLTCACASLRGLGLAGTVQVRHAPSSSSANPVTDRCITLQTGDGRLLRNLQGGRPSGTPNCAEERWRRGRTVRPAPQCPITTAARPGRKQAVRRMPRPSAARAALRHDRPRGAAGGTAQSVSGGACRAAPGPARTWASGAGRAK